MAGPTSDSPNRDAENAGQPEHNVVGTLASDPEDPVWLALAAARMGIWDWNLKSDAVTWSNTTVLAFGLTSERAPSSSADAFELVHPDDRHALSEDCARAIRDGTDLIAEYRIIAGDGAVRWMQSRGRVAYDTAGLASRILGVNLDISDRKLLEEQLLEAHGQAERLKILKATMRTVQDIVSNALMSLHLFRAEAELYVSSPSLDLFDHIIADTAAKLKALGDLENVTETNMAIGTGIEYQSSPPAAKR